MKTAPKSPFNVHIDFEHGLLDAQVKADAYVNAASINPLDVSDWENVAGAIYNSLPDIEKKRLKNHWNKLGKKIPAGSALFAQDENGEPNRFNIGAQPGYIIHAGSPQWALHKQKKVEDTLTHAYLEILNQVKAHNEKNPDKINRIAIPPLGIGIYHVPPEISAQCAYNAMTEFSKNSNLDFEIVIPLFTGHDKNSADYKFGKKLKNLLKSTQKQKLAPDVPHPELVAHHKSEQEKNKKGIQKKFTDADYEHALEVVIHQTFKKDAWTITQEGKDYRITSQTDPNKHVNVNRTADGVKFSGTPGSEQDIASVANHYQEYMQQHGQKISFEVDAQNEKEAIDFIANLGKGGFNIDSIKTIRCKEGKAMSPEESSEYTHRLIEMAKERMKPSPAKKQKLQ